MTHAQQEQDDPVAGRPPEVALLCFIVGRSMETRVMAALADAGFGDLTVAQARVGARLQPDGLRMSVLAEASGVTKQTASFLVTQLESNGYVRRVPDPTDARARLVVLAERGEAAGVVARETERVVQAEWEDHLGTRGYRRLRDLLTRLREVTDPYL
jgi:DNA-binding MarR family transcriptional regulator